MSSKAKNESATLTAAALAKLTENIQTKRQHLNKLYEEINQSPKKKTNLINNVKFDDSDDDTPITQTKENKTKTPDKQRLIKSPIKQVKKQTVAPLVTKVKINTKITKTNNKIKLEQLREKVIKRKFAYLWLRKHFYSLQRTKQLLLPSQINKYYQNKQLDKLFNKWHSDSRFIRNEWRSNVKAQCHYNYTILNKLWLTWQHYTTEHKHETNLDTKASNHYNLKLKQQYFNDLKQFRLNQSKKRSKLTLVELKLNKELISSTFKHWLLKLKQLKELQTLDSAADYHFKSVQLTKVFSIWFYKFSTEKEERRLERLATRHYRKQMFKKCFKSLVYYAQYRKRKQKQKLKLSEYAESQLVYRVYQTWRDKLGIKLKLNDLNEQIEQFKLKYQMIRVFNCWKNNYQNKVKQTERFKQMNKIYEKNLKRKVFYVLYDNYKLVLNEKLDQLRAEKFNIYWHKKLHFSKWSDKLEDKKEINQMHLFYKAKRHYELKILNKSLLYWKQFRCQQLELNAKVAKAVRLYESNLLVKYFQVLKQFVEINKRKCLNHLKAEEMFKSNMFYKFYYLWVQRYEIEIEYQMNNRIAILHFDSSSKQSVFNKWFVKYKEHLTEEYYQERSLVHYNKNLRKKLLHSWYKHLKDIKSNIQNEHIAIKHDFKRLCSPVLTQWKQYLNQSRILNEQALKAVKYYQMKQIKQLFTTWRLQTIEFKAQNQLIEQKFNQKQFEFKSFLFTKWLTVIKNEQTARLNAQIADTFHIKHLMIKIIHQWSQYSQHRSIKQSAQNKAIEQFQHIKQRLLIQKWKQKTKELMSQQAKQQLADRVYAANLNRKLFKEWHVTYCSKSRLMKLKNQQADWFIEMRLKTEFYFKWCSKHQQEQSLKSKNTKALIFWSINIQNKHLNAWFNWYKMNKLKKERYKLALEQRNEDILKVCARKFIQYSTDSKQRRLKATKLLNEKQSIHCLELQSKYYNLWLQKCQFHKLKKSNLVLSTHKQLNIAVNESPSLEKKQQIAVTTVLSPASRAAPRKPAFLLDDSVDLSAKQTKLLVLDDKQENLFAQVDVKPKLAAVLMPPTAFLLGSKPESVKMPILSPSLFSCNKQKSSKDNLELIEFKKKLDNYSIKSDKLKRLKEQEKLLNNCFVSNDSNKTICETILNEQQQIKFEIRELIVFLKNERCIINDLSKRFNL